jgi:DNA polymerase-3 subunit gamma/tau
LLELICARVLLPGADHGTEGLAARLDRIEKRLSIEGTPRVAAQPAPVQPAPAQPRPAAQQASTPAAPEPQPEREPEPEPEPQRAAVPQRQPEPVAEAPREETSAAPAAEGTLSLVDVRRLWPDILEAVKLKRRFTWILLSQHGQVAAVDDKTLTIALANAGARNSFSSGGSEEILRQAAIDVIGHDWRVESIVDPSTQPPPQGGGEPRQPTGRASVSQRQPNPSDEAARRDDADADDGVGGAQLLERELGASIIEEIKHD